MKPDLHKIRWLILDVDGTMTDGGIYIDHEGGETKKFSIKDGGGILLARQGGVETVILTGRESLCVTKRARELDIPYVFQNVKNKKAFLEEFFQKQGIEPASAAYLGDDYNDLSAMKTAGIAACPADAAKKVRETCNYVLGAKGGEGAVRELVEMILEERGILDSCAQQLWGC